MSGALPPAEPFDVPSARPVSTEIPLARPLGPPPLPDEPVDELLLRSSNRGAALVDVFAVFGCLMAFELLVGVVFVLTSGEGVGPDADVPDPETIRKYLLPMLGLRAAAAIGLVWLVLRCRSQPLATIAVVRRSWGLDFAIGGLSTIVAYAMIFFMMTLIWLFAPGLIEQADTNASRLTAMIPRLSLLGFAAMSATVGVYEEVLFRGFLMTRLRRATSSWTAAVLLSTIIFTALHAMDQEAIALVAVAILSIVFSVVTIWRRSLIPAIVGHTLFDLSQLIGLTWQAGDAWT